MNSDKDNVFKIKPAGRHLLTIGRDLIQDKYAAIVELVKNAYDADSKDVYITFSIPENDNKLIIIIEDHGHGMSRDTVIDKWLVPSTDDKLNRKESPKGRTMQGRKGIGRYAASILGDDLLLETINESGIKTEVFLEWSQFEQARHLNDVDVLVDTKKTNNDSSTKLTITANEREIEEWNEKALHNLEFELRKLIPPIHEDKADKFYIYLTFENFWEDKEDNTTQKVEPFPIFDLFDYKISGTLKSDGSGNFEYINNKIKNTPTEIIPIKLEHPTGCGKLTLDIRVYDREPEAIDQLIERGLKDSNDEYLGKNETKNLLNTYNGIAVYRNGFRIRPLGDPGFDWLELDKSRVQNPSMKIGSNQVIGYVQIEAEEQSGLEEKSARDGLKDNVAYMLLKEATKYIISELEKRRFSYRRRAGLSKKAIKIESEFEKLFSFESVKKEIQKKLKKSGLDEGATKDIIDIISKKEEEDSSSIEKIRKAVAIYQGQATLGKIINVILHEGRRPLNFFKNSIPVFLHDVKKLDQEKHKDLVNKIINLAERTQENSNVLSALFARIDPLAAGSRPPKKEFNIRKELKNSFAIFENELTQNKIEVEIVCPKDLKFEGWSKDWYMIFTNLIDNSIFWLKEKKVINPKISISISSNASGEFVHLDYQDNGPGIDTSLIENEVIFEPEFSTKTDGTGLGLAIAGESAARNGLKLKAFESETGAYFRLQLKENNNE